MRPVLPVGRPSCARPPSRARIATNPPTTRSSWTVGRCARPPSRARIATPPSPAATPKEPHKLRPATEPGEDRNSFSTSARGSCCPCCARPPSRARIATRTAPKYTAVMNAAPGHRAGRGSQHRAAVGRGWRRWPLRPATEPGEDRNMLHYGVSESSVYKLRPATEPGEDRNEFTAAPPPPPPPAAPGHRAGRGSQPPVPCRSTARGDHEAAPGHRAGRGSQL